MTMTMKMFDNNANDDNDDGDDTCFGRDVYVSDDCDDNH